MMILSIVFDYIAAAAAEWEDHRHHHHHHQQTMGGSNRQNSPLDFQFLFLILETRNVIDVISIFCVCVDIGGYRYKNGGGERVKIIYI